MSATITQGAQLATDRFPPGRPGAHQRRPWRSTMPTATLAITLLSVISLALPAGQSAVIPLLEDFQSHSNVFGFPVVDGPGVTVDGNGTFAGSAAAVSGLGFTSVTFTAGGHYLFPGSTASYYVSFWARVNQIPVNLTADVRVSTSVNFGGGIAGFGFVLDKDAGAVSSSWGADIPAGSQPQVGEWARYWYKFTMTDGVSGIDVVAKVVSAGGALLAEGQSRSVAGTPIFSNLSTGPVISMIWSIQSVAGAPVGSIYFDMALFQFSTSPIPARIPTQPPTTTWAPFNLDGRPGVLLSEDEAALRWEGGTGLYLDDNKDVNVNSKLLVQGVDLLEEIAQLKALLQNCTCS